MPMRIKNKEWISFKEKFLSILEVLSGEAEKFDLPEDPDNFELFVENCEVLPAFTKKNDYLKVEYDFTLCETKLRTLSFSIYKGAARIEMTLKDDNLDLDDNTLNVSWQENHY